MYEGKVHRIEVWKVIYSRRYITYFVLRLQLFNLFWFYFYIPDNFYP